MKSKRVWVMIFLCAGALLITSLATARSASAQAPVPTSQPASAVSDNDVNRVAKKLYCPVCPNTPLDVCTTTACKDWREQIREQLASGWSDKQVMDYFVRQYGERVLAEPERGGFTSLVWMLPVLVVLLGLILVWLILKNWQARRKAHLVPVEQTPPVTAAVSPDVLLKIEAEIRKLD